MQSDVILPPTYPAIVVSPNATVGLGAGGGADARCSSTAWSGVAAGARQSTRGWPAAG